MPLSEKEQNKLIKGVFDGVISVFNLPDLLFGNTFDEIMKFVDQGFQPNDLKEAKEEIYAGFKKNINEFSADKTISEVKKLTLSVFDENGNKRAFTEFSDIARSIDNTYNLVHLKTEQNSAFSQAQGADRWIRTEAKKKLFPYLKYITSNDEAVRQEHRAWHGIVKRVNDPFWNTRYPANGWNCRCRVVRLREGEVTNLGKHLVQVNKKFEREGLEKLNNLDNTEEVFANHSAKTRLIFNPTKTNYYKDVKSTGLKRGQNNYGLGYK